jgi:hypothetical protein
MCCNDSISPFTKAIAILLVLAALASAQATDDTDLMKRMGFKPTEIKRLQSEQQAAAGTATIQKAIPPAQSTSFPIGLIVLLIAGVILVVSIKKRGQAKAKNSPPQPVTVKIYKGSQAKAAAAFGADANRMAALGYFPSSQVWAPGSYGVGSFLIALLLCIVLIGIIVFIYMLIVKPTGSLTVTYELRQSLAPPLVGLQSVPPSLPLQGSLVTP